MACISLGTINKNMIPILIACIFAFLSKLLLTYKNTNLFSHKIIPNIFGTATKLLTIIPFIIITFRTKKSDESLQKKESSKKKFIYINIKEEIIKGK